MKKILFSISVASFLLTGCTNQPVVPANKVVKPETTTKTIKTVKTVETVQVNEPIKKPVKVPVKPIVAPNTASLNTKELTKKIDGIVRNAVKKNCVAPKCVMPQPIIKTIVNTTKPEIKINVIIKQEKVKPIRMNCHLDENAPIDPSIDTY